jgi:hypothetical protein
MQASQDPPEDDPAKDQPPKTPAPAPPKKKKTSKGKGKGKGASGGEAPPPRRVLLRGPGGHFVPAIVGVDSVEQLVAQSSAGRLNPVQAFTLPDRPGLFIHLPPAATSTSTQVTSRGPNVSSPLPLQVTTFEDRFNVSADNVIKRHRLALLALALPIQMPPAPLIQGPERPQQQLSNAEVCSRDTPDPPDRT